MGKNAAQLLVIGPDKLLQEVLEASRSVTTDLRLAVKGVSSFREGIESVGNLKPEFAIVELGNDFGRGQTLIQEILATSPETNVIPVTGANTLENSLSNRQIVELFRWGAKDFLRRPVSAEELRELLRRLFRVEKSRSAALGTVVTFCSNKGGVGKSTLAVNVATALATRFPGQVLLLDTSLHLGTLAEMLDLKPSSNILAAARQGSRLDSTLLQNLAAAHSSGLALLAAPRDLAEGDFDGDSLAHILNVARRTYRFVIVDTFPVIDSLVVTVLDFSDQAFVVTEATVPTVIGCASLLQLLDVLGYSRSALDVVINRYTAESDNLPVASIEHRLGCSVKRVLPFTKEANVAMNIGTPVVLKSVNPSKQILTSILGLFSRSQRASTRFQQEIWGIVEQLDVLNNSGMQAGESKISDRRLC